ncbi:MAG: serine/threonine-protein phosphatase [Actinomycetota bacterium]|nr:serine/threonine-protein phosphatase [Actinomycetota bacterium]
MADAALVERRPSPPLLIRADGSTRLLDAEADLLLGLDAATPRHDYDIVLEQGETVLLYTDGLVERRGADLDEGLSWLRSSAGRLAGLSLDEVCDALLEDVERDAEDDIALLAVRPRLPAPA